MQAATDMQQNFTDSHSFIIIGLHAGKLKIKGFGYVIKGAEVGQGSEI